MCSQLSRNQYTWNWAKEKCYCLAILTFYSISCICADPAFFLPWIMHGGGSLRIFGVRIVDNSPVSPHDRINNHANLHILYFKVILWFWACLWKETRHCHSITHYEDRVREWNIYNTFPRSSKFLYFWWPPFNTI